MRVYRFAVEVRVHDEDQTDPEDMAETVQAVLNGAEGMITDWKEYINNVQRDWRPKWKVEWTP